MIAGRNCYKTILPAGSNQLLFSIHTRYSHKPSRYLLLLQSQTIKSQQPNHKHELYNHASPRNHHHPRSHSLPRPLPPRNKTHTYHQRAPHACHPRDHDTRARTSPAQARNGLKDLRYAHASKRNSHRPKRSQGSSQFQHPKI